jgi:hypothetical protein
LEGLDCFEAPSLTSDNGGSLRSVCIIAKGRPLGVTPTLELTPAQRSAIYQEVHKDTSKAAPSRFATHVGADVPPTIELYPLPDDIQANSPETKALQVHRGRRRGGTRRPDQNACDRGNRPKAEAMNFHWSLRNDRIGIFIQSV